MKFKIKSQVMFQIIKKIIKIIPVNPVTEIHKNIKLEIENNKLYFYALNERIFIKSFLIANENNLEIFEKGTFLINIKILYELLNKLKDEWILFETNFNNLIISNYKNETSFIFKLNILEIENFPKIDFELSNEKITLPKNIIEEINNQINFVIDLNNSNNILRGINFIFNDQKLLITGTDRISMAQKTININSDINSEVTIPVNILNDIEKITNDLDKEYNFYFIENNNVIIENNNFLFKGRIIEGNYPKIQNIINHFLLSEENDIILINDLKNFLNTIELAVILSKKEMVPLIELLIDKKNKKIEIKCISNNHNFGEINEYFSNFEFLKFNGQENDVIKISFNYFLLTHALKSFNKCKKIMLHISKNKHTIINSAEDLSLQQLVLPIIKN